MILRTNTAGGQCKRLPRAALALLLAGALTALAGAGWRAPATEPTAPAEESGAASVEVQDAFSYQGVYTDPDNSAYTEPIEYHVPQLLRDGEPLQAVNDRLWQELYEEDLAVYGSLGQEEFYTGTMSMDYDWYVNGDVLSLVVTTYWGPESPFYSYLVYNVSISRGEFLSPEEVLAQAGTTREAYRTALSALLAGYVNAYTHPDGQSHDLALTQTLQNVEQSCPFLGEDGALCARAELYHCYAVLEYYSFLFDLQAGTVYGEQAQMMGTDALTPDVSDAPAANQGENVWEVYNDLQFESGGSYLYSQILLDPSAHRYVAAINLLEMYGTVTGTYTESDSGEICCQIGERNFWGYGDEGVTEFRLQRQGSVLTPTQTMWTFDPLYGVAYLYDHSFTLTPESGTGTVTGSGVHFRSGPGTDNLILFDLGQGETLDILGSVPAQQPGEDGWYMARYTFEGVVTTGYISAAYVQRAE